METNNVLFHTSLFYNIYLYILKDIMRGSIAPEPEDFCIFICLNAALLGPPKPNSVLQSLVSICCTLFFCTFSNFPGGTIPPYINRGGDVSPPVPPGIAAPGGG